MCLERIGFIRYLNERKKMKKLYKIMFSEEIKSDTPQNEIKNNSIQKNEKKQQDIASHNTEIK